MTAHYIPEVPLNVALQASRRRPARARTPRMESLSFTFKKLHDYMHRRILSGSGLSASSWSNLNSAYNAFLEERKYSPDDHIGSRLRASYRVNVDAHSSELRKEGRPTSYISNRRSLLTQWRRALVEADHASAAKAGRATPFQSAIDELLAKTGATYKGTARASGVPLATLKRWKIGGSPNARSVKWVPRIENYFALPPGTLGDLLPLRLHGIGGETKAKDSIPYRERQAGLVRSQYALKDPCNRLRREWEDFLKYKVALGQSARRDLRRSKSGRWSTTDLPVERQTTSNWFAFHGGRYVATADVVWSYVSQYLGWLQLSEEAGGKGLPAEQAQTLSNLARNDVLEDYIAWRTARSGGVSHGGMTRWLQLVASVTHAKTGYLTQTANRFPGHAYAQDPQTWAAMCQETFDLARALQTDLGEVTTTSRDSFEPIKDTLALANPLEAVADAVARMDADRPCTGGVLEAQWARDRLLLKLLASNPLRDKNARMLRYRSDNKGHLRKVDGGWRIFIPKAEFKNFKGAAKDRDYDMPVRQEVWSDIERYLQDYRPMLTTAQNPYVFVSGRANDRPWALLGKQFASILRSYLLGCPGTGTHAMRHIVATAILKANPNAWTTAAMVLHDREDTVRAHYVHLAANDVERWLGSSLSSAFARM